MNTILQFLKEYSLIGGTAITFTAIGWIIRNVFDVFIENKKYKRELKTYFWKEKINASKKASEFYLEYSNFLNLSRLQFEHYEIGKIEHQTLIENLQKEVGYYSDKLKAFPHFEHHHINIFYEFNEQKSIEITNSIYKTLREISEIKGSENDAEINVENLYKRLKENYSELLGNQQIYLNKIRTELKEFL